MCRPTIILLPVLAVPLLAGCSGKRVSDTAAPTDTATTTEMASDTTQSWKQLTTEQRNRIGPRLQRLMKPNQRSPDEVEPVGRRDGAPLYSVTVRCSEAEALRETGLSVTSVQGTIVTARWTLREVQTAATIDAVQIVQAAAEAQVQ